jgi:hypothetical protein
MNFYSQNEKPLSLYGFLILAFEARLERFWLDAGNQRYLVTAEYAETPKVRCNLSVAAEEQDRWISLYSGETLANKNLDNGEGRRRLSPKKFVAINSNQKLRKDLLLIPGNEGSTHIELGHYETEREAALAYDRAAIPLYGDKADTNFPPEESEHVVLSEEVMRQINALKGGRGRLH